MTVLQLISSGGGFYGAERVSVTLAAELRTLEVEVIVAAFRNTGKAIHLEVLDQAKAAGLATEWIDCKGRLDRKAITTIRDMIERHGVDVVHSHGIKADLYALLAGRGTKARLVSTCHSWTMDSPKHWLISVLDRLLLRKFDAVAIVSESLHKRLWRLGIAAEKIHVVHNGIDCVPFVAISGPDVRRRAAETQEVLVGTVSRLVPVKGLQYLLEAAAVLLHEFPLTKFVIVGDGPESEPLRRRAASLKIANSVHFAGNRNDMVEVYSSLDVFVLPSLSEAMPMALMEGLWPQGLPCGRVSGVDRFPAW